MTDEGKGLTLMVVEDNDFQRAVATKVLEDLGCETVLSAPEGDAALKQIVNHPGRVHIVLSDLDMPGMDGIEFLRHLAEGDLADAAAIASAMDASLIHTVEQMIREHGIQVLSNVSKPVTRAKMISVIEQYRQEHCAPSTAYYDESFSSSEVSDALDNDQFEVWYQPKVRVSDGAWVASEALARWRHPEQGVIMPGRFVQVMEENGLINRLTWQQVHRVVEDLHHWQEEGRDLSVAINFSPLLMDDVESPRKLEEILDYYGVAPCHIILELTETMIIKSVARCLETAARLRIKGFHLSIDDFGTGFSNQQRLNRIPFTELKIDRSFVRDLENRESARSIVASNIDLATRLKMKSVAEGVETPGEWHALKNLNCDLIQGYLIAKPMPMSELNAWESQWREHFKQLKSQ